MTYKQAHGLDHILGVRLVSSHAAPPRRKTEGELRRMPIEERLLYEMRNPLSDEERLAEVEHQMMVDDYEMGREVDPRMVLDNQPPPDWGE